MIAAFETIGVSFGIDDKSASCQNRCLFRPLHRCAKSDFEIAAILQHQEVDVAID